MITLTMLEIKHLAELAGLRVDASNFNSEDMETEITIEKCPVPGLLNDDGNVEHFGYIAYFAEYPEEGSIGLGDPVEVHP